MTTIIIAIIAITIFLICLIWAIILTDTIKKKRKPKKPKKSLRILDPFTGETLKTITDPELVEALEKVNPTDRTIYCLALDSQTFNKDRLH